MVYRRAYTSIPEWGRGRVKWRGTEVWETRAPLEVKAYLQIIALKLSITPWLLFTYTHTTDSVAQSGQMLSIRPIGMLLMVEDINKIPHNIDLL